MFRETSSYTHNTPLTENELGFLKPIHSENNININNINNINTGGMVYMPNRIITIIIAKNTKRITEK